ncbi:glycosyl hydrolase 53 family protein [Myceligenerans indicum]|uniref:Arabinogalactan endo-beta-1,4-galactanase n=1 Tax=Myceligenerans indicum TaxID=2593663 RepID=A0ABS1LP88_9MICO|nr:glycosyl hydrolase 53 family protein [Myceligenerans indicum]MBL0888042.1 DUF1416 domain-containing protein [Myceligenerans indicum]
MSILRRSRRPVAATAAGALCATGLAVAVPAPAQAADPVPVPNASFEEWTGPDSWVASSWSMTSTVWVTSAAARTGTYSQAVDQWNDATTLSQTLTAPEGTYDVSLFVWANEDLGTSALVANGTSVAIASGGATQIDGTKTWDEIRVEDVAVGTDGALDIEIVIPELTSATLTGFIDDVSVTPAVAAPDEPGPADSVLVDPGFEDGGTAWQIGGKLQRGGHDGSSHSVRHTSRNAQTTSQVVESLEDGYYRLTAWVQNDGGYDEAYLFASGGGESDATTAVPRTNFAYDAAGTWKKTTLRGVHVTSGRLEVGLRTSGTGQGTVRIDDLALVKDAAPYEMLVGGDISMLTYVEDLGGRYADAAGRERDPLETLADSGWNIARIRVYNDPGKGHGDGAYYVPAGYVDADDALSLAARAKAAGLQIQLSFHYSDYWTNPGIQLVPHAWQELIAGKDDDDAVTTLETQVHAYTRDLLERMADQGTSPEYVSIGNETRSGMLLPFGSTSNWPDLARFYNAGAAAVREADPGAKVIIHLDDGGNTSTYQTYFTNADDLGVDYDVIGTSYYPFWTNKSAPRFASFATTISQQFGKPILIMETGFNYQAEMGEGGPGQLGDNGPYGDADSSSPELQRDFMIELFNEMQGVPGGTVIGDLYWDPVLIHAGGRTGWAYFESTDRADVNAVDNTTLFDMDGRALPVLDAYRLNTRGTDVGVLAGQVTDGAGQPVAGATVTLAVAGDADRTTVTNAYGDYRFARSAPGEHTVRAEKDTLGESGTVTVSVSAGARAGANLRLPEEQVLRSFSGTVQDQGGSPVPGASVRIEGEQYTSTILTQSAGEFEFPAVPDGTYTLSVMKDGYVTAPVSAEVCGSDVVRAVELVQDVGAVSGHVFAPDGRPLGGAVVTVGGQETATSGDGSYLVEGVGSGTGLVAQAGLPGYLDTFSAAFTVEQGVTTSGVDVTLPLEVAVTNGSFETAGEGGETTAAGWTFASDPAGAVVRQDREYFGGTVDGRYAATFWLDTPYTASLEQSVPAASPGIYSARAQVQAGVTGTFTMYLKDDAGNVLAEKQVANSASARQVELSAEVPSGSFTMGFRVEGSAGDWAVVDLATAGYLGATTAGNEPAVAAPSDAFARWSGGAGGCHGRRDAMI